MMVLMLIELSSLLLLLPLLPLSSFSLQATAAYQQPLPTLERTMLSSPPAASVTVDLPFQLASDFQLLLSVPLQISPTPISISLTHLEPILPLLAPPQAPSARDAAPAVAQQPAPPVL